jgi:hypothetical protein
MLLTSRVEAELASVRQAIPILESQLEAAKRHAEARAYEIEEAVEVVFVAEAETLTARYIEQIRETREVLNTLRFLAARKVQRDPSERGEPSAAPVYYGNETTRQICMPGYIIAACHDDCVGDSEVRGRMRVRGMVSKAVTAYWQRLHGYADAKLEIGQLPPPFDPHALMAKLKANESGFLSPTVVRVRYRYE